MLPKGALKSTSCWNYAPLTPFCVRLSTSRRVPLWKRTQTQPYCQKREAPRREASQTIRRPPVVDSPVMSHPKNLHKALGLDRKAGPISALHVFDFDGTLVRTPSPEVGKPKYLQAIGKPWTGGWWGRPGSLTPPVVESPFPSSLVISSVFDELEQVVTRSETAVAVVLTGRIKHLREHVVRILNEICISRKNDTVPSGQSFLHPNAVFTHPGGGLSTLDFKMQFVKNLLTSEPLAKVGLKELHLWEDRKDHADTFATRFSEELLVLCGVSTTVHFIPEDLR